MLKQEFAEWIRQVFFPVQVFEGVGAANLYYRERTSASLQLGNMVARIAGGIWADAVRWRRRRCAVAGLHACSDRTLRDLGMDRSEILSIVNFGGFGRRRGPIDFD